MEYLIHVVDESSQHAKNIDNQEFDIIDGVSEKGEVGQIIRSDAFYLISDNSVINAVIAVANIINIKDENNKPMPLSNILSKNNEDNENSAIGDDSFLPLKVSDLTVVENTNSELIKTSCQIKRTNGEETWTELHNIYFFVTPREKIVFVK